MFNFFSKRKKSNEIIKRYVNGIVNEDDFDIYDFSSVHHTYKSILIKRLNEAVQDFLKNADIHELNENRNKKEFMVFANAHELKYEESQKIFAEILELVMSNKTILLEYEYKQEKPKNLIDR